MSDTSDRVVDQDSSFAADVAVVGMAGRFSGANDVDELWRRVASGDDCLTLLAREELVAAGVPAREVDSSAYVRRAGVLDEVEGFDYRFFGIGARDAAVMDPQHRHFLECAWEALESAAIVPERFDGAIGVFGGCGMNTYLINNLITNGNVLEQLGWFLLRHTGNDKDFLTNNVSYRLDLRGPAVNVQTACSTSLVAVHLAVQSLLAFECDAALAGGVTINVPHRRGYEYREGEILAPDGVCRAYDAGSQGTVITSGVAVVTLRRLADALADGDPVLAVIKGTAINNDGSRKVGFLAPSVDAHADVIRDALTVAGLSATDIQLFEGHGTGTSVGDPIEVAAATAAFRSWTDRNGFCHLTSTKPNIGHTDTAAGAASLIKVVQAMQHRTFPPLANHTAASPLLDIENTPFLVAGTAEPWSSDSPRRAGISSLGVGGTNAHVVIEEAPPTPVADHSVAERVLALSARTPEALDLAAERLAGFLDRHPDTDLAAVAHTLVAGRRAMSHRRVVVADDVPTAISALRGDDRVRSAQGPPLDDDVRLGLMFPGGGSQYPGMAAGLDPDRFATFHEVRSEGLRLVRQASGVDLAPLLESGADPDALRPPTASLPAVFITSVALARQWLAFGAAPDLLVGHSLGEYVAAHLAGVMSFEDAVRLVVVRSRLMQQASGNDAAMLVVPVGEAELLDMLPPELSLAVVNADDECVVAGRRGPIEALAARLEERGAVGSVIPLSAAAHSSLLDPILDEFASEVRTVRLNPPEMPYLSNLSGTWITSDQATDAQYWVDHLRGTVRFAQCIRTAVGDTSVVLTEVGPGQTLSSLARRARPGPAAAIASLRHPSQDIPDTAYTLHAFARQWAAGAAVDLSSITEETERRLRLPTYPFQHERCWIEPGTASAYVAPPDPAVSGPVRELPRRIDQLENAVWQIEWDIADEPVEPEARGSWMVIGDDGDELVDDMVSALAARGLTVGRSIGGQALDTPADLAGVLVVAPVDNDDYEASRRRWLSDASGVIKSLGAMANETRFVAMTRGAFAVDSPASRPEDAMALGITLVAQREYPALTTRIVDVAASDGSSLAPTSAIVDDVLGCGPQTVSHHQGVRRTPALRPADIRGDGDRPTFRDGGTYIVTGALGGVGHVLAMHLAGAHGAHVVVLSSTDVPEGDARARWLANHAFDDPTSRRIRRLAEIERVGGKVTVVVADMASPESIRQALDEVQRTVGDVDGAIHAAGLVRDALIEFADDRDTEAVLGAKARGALVLTEELARRGAELLLLVSSTSTVLAPHGQASYVAANAVLDALSGRHGPLRVVTINFGLWSGVGIASELARRDRLGIGQGESIDHPVFSELHRLADGAVALVGRLDAELTWLVDEHRTTDGTAVLPGTGHLYLMSTAAQLSGRETSSLIDVAFLTPLIVPSESPVTLRVVVSSDGLVEIQSDEGRGHRWSIHSHASAVREEPSESDEGHDGGATDLLPAEFEFMERIEVDLLASQRNHMNFGPRWESVLDAATGDGVVAAHLRLRTDDPTEAVRWSPHPALVDLAVAAGVNLAEAGPGFYVPSGCRRVTFLGAVPEEVFVRAVETETSKPERLRVDLMVTDTSGTPVLSISGLELIRARSQSVLAPAPIDDHAFTDNGVTLAALADELGVRPSDGIEFVERLIASDHDRLIASTIDIDDLVALVEEGDETAAVENDQAPGSADTLEGAMSVIWSDLLGRPDIGPDEDFFDLGGHSLIAIRLMARIHSEFGTRLQLAAIFDAPTIATLAAHLRSEHPDIDERFGARAADATAGPSIAPAGLPVHKRHLVPISSNGDRRPLYIVHGAGGNVLFLGNFGRALTDRPVYGFQAHGVDSDDVPDHDFESMASRYVAELTDRGPGPYLLGGYSGGGAVALEMTRLLQADGEQVDVVVLFDSPVGRISLGRMVHARHLLRHLLTKGPQPLLPIVTYRLQETELGRKLLFRGRRSVHQESHYGNYEEMTKAGFRDLYDHFTEASDRFEVGVYDVDAILVKAQLRWPMMSDDYGWSDRIAGRLDVIAAPGDHESMFHAVNAGVLVAELAPLLDRYDE